MRKGSAVLVVWMLCVLALHTSEALARARGGGSRGSRSYSAPVAPSRPSRPARDVATAATADVRTAPSAGGSVLGGVAGFVTGGLLGGLFLRGGGYGQAFGLLDLLLLLGGLSLFLSYLKSRQEPASTLAYAGAGSGTAQAAADGAAGLEEAARRAFVSVKGAMAMGDMALVRDRLTPEMLATLQGHCDELRAARRTTRVGRIGIERGEVVRTWQDAAREHATLRLTGKMLAGTIDATGAVLAGSVSEPRAFDETWTFSRPIGSTRWKLASIDDAPRGD